MSLTVTHAHVSAIADDGSDVGSNAWNANHTVSGTLSAATDLTGILPTANGGTGQGSLASANIAVTNATNTFSIEQDFALGTITSNAKAISITATWNNSGVTFDAPLLVTVTNTASHAGSRVADFMVGATTVGYFDANGLALHASNSTSVYQLHSDAFTTTGINIDGSGFTHIGAGAGDVAVFGSPDLQLPATNAILLLGPAATSRLKQVGVANTSGIISQEYTTVPQGWRIYNTTDGAVSPTNYERGVFDWITTSNVLTIGTQAGGTGTGRNLNLAVTANNDIYLSEGGAAIFAARKSVNAVVVGFSFPLLLSGNDAQSGALNSGTGITLVANKVASLTDASGNAGAGWLQYAGQKRVTADFGTATATLSTVTDLTVALTAGRTYSFDIWLQMTDAAAGGVQAAVSSDGTLTATAIQYTGYTIDNNAIKGLTNSTALGTAVGSTTTTNTSGIVIVIKGTITVNVAGSMLVQIAQNTSNATNTTVKRGSYMIIQDMP